VYQNPVLFFRKGKEVSDGFPQQRNMSALHDLLFQGKAKRFRSYLHATTIPTQGKNKIANIFTLLYTLKKSFAHEKK
jgi:hypothetical protein